MSYGCLVSILASFVTQNDFGLCFLKVQSLTRNHVGDVAQNRGLARLDGSRVEYSLEYYFLNDEMISTAKEEKI